MYRHALPPGFVLKSQRKALDAAAKAADSISLEEFIEVEVRISSHKLGAAPILPGTNHVHIAA